MIIGEVLRRRRLISESQLEHALAVQKEKLVELGQAVPLGMVIVELGYADEAALVEAVNEHYRLTVDSLSDNIKELVAKVRGTFVERLPAPRIPIWLQLAVTTILVITLTTVMLNYVILNRQKEQLYNQTLKIGSVSLNYFDNNAWIPLLEENDLQLNTLIKNTAQVEGLVYAFIVDTDNRIRAHTDLAKIGTEYKPAPSREAVRTKSGDRYYTLVLPDKRKVINIMRPIIFKDKNLGQVHVGVSIDFIEQLVNKEQTTLLMIALGVILMGIFIALFLGFRYSRPIKTLMMATEEISRGNYRHHVDLKRNDELGNLAAAFNRMTGELWKNQLMQESFGKYVGSEVLELIMANPQQTWLKGHRNEASILFADIRGFTSFSDTREPEVVVEMLNRYFEIATHIILAYGGYIDKFMGDAVLGVFGVPVFRKDHAERAVRAALAMQDELQKARKNGIQMFDAIGIGIDSGIVVSGNIGSQAKMEYTVIGDSVNVASRLNAIAGPGDVIVSRNVYDSIETVATAEALPAQRIKGKSDPIEIFRILGIRERPHIKAPD